MDGLRLGKTWIRMLLLLFLVSLVQIAPTMAANYLPPWTIFGSIYGTKVYPAYVNSAWAAAYAGGTSVSVSAYSIAWTGAVGAIAVAQQTYRFVAPSANYVAMKKEESWWNPKEQN